MFGLSTGHLLILGFVVLLFGHRRLPELGTAFGNGMRSFKKGLNGPDKNADPADRPNTPNNGTKA
jgi:sec-independent protein translocase protein TatA